MIHAAFPKTILKMVGRRSFLFESRGLFSGAFAVSFRECMDSFFGDPLKQTSNVEVRPRKRCLKPKRGDINPRNIGMDGCRFLNKPGIRLRTWPTTHPKL